MTSSAARAPAGTAAPAPKRAGEQGGRAGARAARALCSLARNVAPSVCTSPETAQRRE